jgi:uncharacterized coiled-coil protein SlyX
LRDAILIATHQWPVILAFCLAGCLLGWGVSMVWPSPYQATEELYVGLNVYRASQDTNAAAFAGGLPFNYIDDYKNWQMANLNALVEANDVTRETLDELRAANPYWLNVTREELAGKLHVYWRNVGKWRLVAEDPNPQRASQIASTWQRVVIKTLNHAVAEAQKTMDLDYQLQSLASKQTELGTRLIELNQIQDELQSWEDLADQPADSLKRWQLWSLAANAAGTDPTWITLLEAYPASDAPAAEYSSWVEKASASLKDEIQILQSQLDDIQQEQDRVKKEYAAASQGSRGFSTNMVVEAVSEKPPKAAVVRPVSLLALIGGGIGLIIWALVWLARIAMRARAE